ncbi:S-adenosyl-L-methionine-dependent methyltransferase [Myriangium duriaei CBS 260.36]|uniref:S-adenosyl-L-methionine-dependent methyltransferase n=1 Tax=Myriangium duriaei CBS 260.36 TaxID=1168546 RepID=A0A9P4JAQ2_9PEZI|nr:S-adenosyl-L-methionine-dependent methyltransferase [Myriangium duriaei CBS 260.36]
MSQRSFAEASYDAGSAVYDDSHHPAFARWMAEHANLKPAEHVLDLACGTGLATFAAADKVGPNGSVIGIDVSTGMLEQAGKKKDAGSYENVSLFNHDIADLDTLDAVQNKQFDVIIEASALVLMEDPVSCARSYLPYLKNGGRFIVDSHDAFTMPDGLAMELTGKKLCVPVGYNTAWATSGEALQKVLELAGFKVGSIIFKDQDYPAREIKVSDADAVFEKFVKRDIFVRLGADNIKAQAKQTFKDVLSDMAKGKGFVKVNPGVWVATAYKP